MTKIPFNERYPNGVRMKSSGVPLSSGMEHAIHLPDILDVLIAVEEGRQTLHEKYKRLLYKTAEHILTKRQHEIFMYKMSGYSNSDIGVLLKVSKKTIEKTYNTIQTKLIKALNEASI